MPPVAKTRIPVICAACFVAATVVERFCRIDCHDSDHSIVSLERRGSGPRDRAVAKLEALVAGARLVRAELATGESRRPRGG